MEYFIESNSFAAPFCSDEGKHYVEAESPKDALESLAKSYSHPAGLYSAACYTSSEARNKGEKPLAMWLCNRAQAEKSATAGLGCYSIRGIGPDRFELNDELIVVKSPKRGSIMEAL